MKIRLRKYSGEADQEAMAALVHRFPEGNLHVADLPYRLSSWAFDDPENVGLWVNEAGELIAWAVLQAPFWTIDCACHPQVEQSLYRRILDWAYRRARQALGTPGGRPAWYVNVFAGQTERIRLLEGAGFASQADVGEDSWSIVFMQLSAQTPSPNVTPPAGFTIRPLAGESEVEAYVELHRAVFESKNMTVEWRRRTLRRPEYLPDLDLVAVAPDGRLAAFCIGWLDSNPAGQPGGQIEPLGVHQDYRKSGLGRAILAEGLRRLQLNGAQRVVVETDQYRNAALELYQSAGFRVIQDVLVYRKDYG
jgi:mycothiol synthase